MLFREKNVIVAGGCGLIGSVIAQQFLEAHAKVKTLDLHQSADIVDDLAESKFEWVFDNLDVFVNASYPRNPEKHFKVFLDASNIIASRMADNDGGVIVNISSIYGVIGGKPSMYVDTGVQYPPVGYSAAKGAIIAMSRALACKYGSYGVRVNCVSPGGVYDGQDPVFVERYNQRVPLGRIATPEDVADAVVFLASDKAKYITGVNLTVDGGITAQ